MTFQSKMATAAAADRARHEQQEQQRLAELHGLDRAAWLRMAGHDHSARLMVDLRPFLKALQQASMSMEEMACVMQAVVPAAGVEPASGA